MPAEASRVVEEGKIRFGPLVRRVAEGRCAVCGDALSVAARHACPRCGLLHHEECWRWAGGCAAFGCGARVRRALPGGRRPAAVRSAPFGSRPSFALVAPSRARRCGRWLLSAVAVTALGLGVFALSYWAAPVLAPLGLGATFLHDLGERLRRQAVGKEGRTG